MSSDAGNGKGTYAAGYQEVSDATCGHRASGSVSAHLHEIASAALFMCCRLMENVHLRDLVLLFFLLEAQERLRAHNGTPRMTTRGAWTLLRASSPMPSTVAHWFSCCNGDFPVLASENGSPNGTLWRRCSTFSPTHLTALKNVPPKWRTHASSARH